MDTLTFELLDSATSPAAEVNEDRVGHQRNLAWVIDGATPVGANDLFTGTDTAWLAGLLDEKLRHTAVPSGSLLDHLVYLSREIEEEATRLNPGWRSRAVYELPSYAIAAVRLKEQSAEYVVLGDCSILHGDASRFKRLTDDRIKSFSDKTIEAMLDPARSHHDQLRENRNKMNRPGGYWIGDLKGEGFAHALTGEFACRPGTKITLCSDGYERISELYKVFEPVDLLDMDIAEVLRIIRKIEEEDPDCSHFPRVKACDDASAIRLKVIS